MHYGFGQRDCSIELVSCPTIVFSNIPNFGLNTYRLVPMDYDDYLDVLFLYWVDDPTTYKHDDFFLYIGRKPIIDDICICLSVLAMDPEAHD